MRFRRSLGRIFSPRQEPAPGQSRAVTGDWSARGGFVVAGLLRFHAGDAVVLRLLKEVARFVQVNRFVCVAFVVVSRYL